jgi:hypothetical protein
MDQQSHDQQPVLPLVAPGPPTPSAQPEPDPASATPDDLWTYIRLLQEQLRQSTAREAYLLAHVQSRLSVPEERELRQTTVHLQAERDMLVQTLTAVQQRYNSQQRALIVAILCFLFTATGFIWLLAYG